MIVGAFLCALLTLSSLAAGESETVVSESSAVPEEEVAGPSDSALRDAAARLQRGEPVSDQVTLDSKGRLMVEVVHPVGQGPDEVITSRGGRVIDSAFGVTLAAVPPESVVLLEADPSVDYVRAPLAIDAVIDPPSPESDTLDLLSSVIGEEVQKTGVSAWHAAGFDGSGVRVGVIDSFHEQGWASAQAAGEVPQPAGTFCRRLGASCSVFQGGPETTDNNHGVAVAEIVHEMAPGADLYLVSATLTGDLDAAVDYLIGQGVDIITRSLGAPYDGPGDGTGTLALVQDKAVDAGIVWFNSAGNHAGSGSSNRVLEANDGGHWRGTWTDPNANGFLNFDGGGEILRMLCGEFFAGLRWDDFGAPNPTDYDIYLWDTDESFALEDAFFVSSNRQTQGQDPIERLGNFNCHDGADIDYMAIRVFATGNGTAGDVLQLAGGGLFDPWNNPYSATQPFADTRSAGGMAVGAIDPATGTNIAPYSSRGPTHDGRTKPDIAAAACVKSYTFARLGRACFNGTSSATPAVAGAAAVIEDAGVAATPDQIKDYLLERATVDRGPDGPDNTFGVGELVLPSPPSDSSPPTWPSQATLQATDSGERGFTLHWSAASDDKGVAGYRVYQAPGTPDPDGFYRGELIAETSASVRSRAVAGLIPGEEYAFWVEAFDSSDNQSTDGPLAVFRTAQDFVDTNTSVFHDDIAWLSATGITLGCNPPVNDRFCPDQSVTRGQMASFLVRALSLEGGENRSYFEDIGDSVHATDINRLAFWEVTAGCNPNAVPPNTRFCPDQPVTRAQMASFLTRSFSLSDGGDTDYFNDDDSSVHEFDINRLAHADITKGCNPPHNTIFCPNGPVTRAQMAAFMHRARDHINAFRQRVGTELLPASADHRPLQRLEPAGTKSAG